MLDEKSVEKLVKLLGKKKFENNIKDQVKIFDGIKGILGASNIDRMRLQMEFKNDKDYEKHIKDYIKKYSNDITEYSNRILMLNERITSYESEDEILELYGLLMGFVSFLIIKGLDL